MLLNINSVCSSNLKHERLSYQAMAPGHPGTAGEEPLFSPFHEILVQGQPGLGFPRSSSMEGPQCRMHPGMGPCRSLSPAYLQPPAPNPIFLANFPAINSF